MDAITFLDVIKGTFYGSLGIVMLSAGSVIINKKLDGWMVIIPIGTIVAIISTGIWIYNGLIENGDLKYVIISLIMTLFTVGWAIKEYKSGKKDKYFEDESFQLWAVITEGTEPTRSLEEEENIQRICQKICRNLTRKELETLLSIKPNTWKESKELCHLLSEQQ
ncbi:MAG: hypothetical protein IJE43_18240 [Alphaproteobacteria bacterium]|nr:hypothetical protein [Alphaproteobacteria bacterium]